jgi:hypothetical protein
MGKKSDSGPGLRIRDEQPGSYSESLETIFWLKILEFFDADSGSPNGKNSDPGWKEFGSAIKEKCLFGNLFEILICFQEKDERSG